MSGDDYGHMLHSLFSTYDTLEIPYLAMQASSRSKQLQHDDCVKEVHRTVPQALASRQLAYHNVCNDTFKYRCAAL